MRTATLERVRASAFLVAVFVASLLGGCGAEAQCPRTLAEARDREYPDGAFVGGGFVIRYVAAPDDERDARGYDLNITRVLTPTARRDPLHFLRVASPVPGIASGQAVLVVAERGERPNVLVPGECPPLVPLANPSQVEP